MFVKSAVAVALFASFAAAQSGGSKANSTIDAGSVDLGVRAGWCNGQIPTCGNLCRGDTKKNDCDENTLTFNCLCSSNGSAPGLEYYEQSLPTFICQEIFQRCIKANENNRAGQDLCTTNQKKNCGTLNSENFIGETSSTSSTPNPTVAPTSPGTGPAAGSQPSTTSSTGAAATLAVAREYGTGMIAAGVAAAFGLML